MKGRGRISSYFKDENNVPRRGRIQAEKIANKVNAILFFGYTS
jgi:hypothetical protein